MNKKIREAVREDREQQMYMVEQSLTHSEVTKTPTINSNKKKSGSSYVIPGSITEVCPTACSEFAQGSSTDTVTPSLVARGTRRYDDNNVEEECQF